MIFVATKRGRATIFFHPSLLLGTVFGSGIGDRQKSGSGINIPDPQHCLDHHLVHGLESGLGHADAAGVELHDALVGLVAPLPDPVVRRHVRALNVEHQVLDEGNLGASQ